MDELPELAERLRPAYELFLGELETHLTSFDEVGKKLNSITDVEHLADYFKRIARKLERHFHLIKGGAGFLKLQAIAQIGGQGEKWFKSASLTRDDLYDLKSEFAALIESLQEETDALRDLLRPKK